MRYEGTRPSKVDSDINVHVFGMGIEEVKLFHAILEVQLRNIPFSTETTVMRGRLRNMKNTLQRMLYDYNKGIGQTKREKQSIISKILSVWT